MIKEKYPRKHFIAKKGQVLLWHGLLIHGGCEVKNKTVTRRSNVIHYMTPGVDQVAKIAGPYRWG